MRDDAAGLGQEQAAEQSSVFSDQLEYGHGPDQSPMASSYANIPHYQPSACTCSTFPHGNCGQLYNINAKCVNIYNSNNKTSNDNHINNRARESVGSEYSVHVNSEASGEPQ